MDQRLSPENNPDESSSEPKESNPKLRRNQYSYYYSRSSAYSETDTPVFAPPVKLAENSAVPMQAEGAEPAPNQAVYHRRRVETEAKPQEDTANQYQAQEEAGLSPASRAAKKRWNPFWLLLILPVIMIATVLILGLRANKSPAAVPTESASVESTSTPRAVSAFSAYSQPSLSNEAKKAIAQLAPMLSFEDALQSDQSILLRQPCAENLWDFYLFFSENGKLIAYFDRLGKDDACFLSNGDLYVKQSPFLLQPDGGAVISAKKLEQEFGSDAKLHPFYGNWAAVENKDGEWGLISKVGERFSSLEFAKLFPFGKDYTVAYLDTGNSSQSNERYMLYLLQSDGSSVYWKNAADTDEIVLCAMDMAITRGGDVYLLPEIKTPAFHSSTIILYPDFDAMVLRNDTTGKLGLYVHGELYGNCEYDAIAPSESTLPWKTAVFNEDGYSVAISSLSPQLYALPSTYSFTLQNQNLTDHVSLSLTGHEPLLLDGELPAPMEVVQ